MRITPRTVRHMAALLERDYTSGTRAAAFITTLLDSRDLFPASMTGRLLVLIDRFEAALLAQGMDRKTVEEGCRSLRICTQMNSRTVTVEWLRQLIPAAAAVGDRARALRAVRTERGTNMSDRLITKRTHVLDERRAPAVEIIG
jgi:hypothetical protein